VTEMEVTIVWIISSRPFFEISLLPSLRLLWIDREICDLERCISRNYTKSRCSLRFMEAASRGVLFKVKVYGPLSLMLGQTAGLEKDELMVP
jgi:hypothetical protein